MNYRELKAQIESQFGLETPNTQRKISARWDFDGIVMVLWDPDEINRYILDVTRESVQGPVITQMTLEELLPVVRNLRTHLAELMILRAE